MNITGSNVRRVAWWILVWWWFICTSDLGTYKLFMRWRISFQNFRWWSKPRWFSRGLVNQDSPNSSSRPAFFLPHIREIPFCMDGEKPWKTWCFVVLNALDERESRSKKNGSGILNWCLQGHKRFMISCVEYYGKRKQIQPKSLRETKQLGEKSWSFPMGVVWALENPETRVTWSHIQVFNGLSIIKINYFEDSWIHGFQRRICKHTNIHHDAK